MVNINRHQLPKKDIERLLVQLDSVLAKLDNKQTGVFLSEVLGYEERLTIAKRLAAIILILEGYTEYKTAKLLKLSPTTVNKVAIKIKNGDLDGTLVILGKSKKDYFAILNTLDSILHLGGILPHRNGLDRYRGI